MIFVKNPEDIQTLGTVQGFQMGDQKWIFPSRFYAAIICADKEYVDYIPAVIDEIRRILKDRAEPPLGFPLDIRVLSEVIKPRETIPQGISRFLEGCLLGIVLLDGLRPNITYELGVLDGLNRPIIILYSEGAHISAKSLWGKMNQKKTLDVTGIGSRDWERLMDPPLEIDCHLSDLKGQWIKKVPNYINNPELFRKILLEEINKIKKDVLDLAILNTESSKQDIKISIDYYQNKYEESLKLIDKRLMVEPANALLCLAKSVNLIQLNRFSDALSAAEKAININPDFAEAWSNKGIALACLKEYDKAILSFEKALEIKPDLIAAINNKAHALNKLHRNQASVEAYKKAIILSPEDPSLWNDMASVYADLGQYDNAYIAIQKAIEIDPKNPMYWFNKGNALTDLNKIPDAIIAYDKAIELNPKYISPQCNKGILLFNNKEYLAAVHTFDRITEIDKYYGDAWYNKGLALFYLNRKEEAVEAIQTALSIFIKQKEKGRIYADLARSILKKIL